MFTKETYKERRKRLLQDVKEGVILLLGNQEVGMNYADNCYPFRQDSSFLYFFGLDKAGLACLLNTADGSEILFGTDPTMDDIVWTGTQPALKELGELADITTVQPITSLGEYLKKTIAVGGTIHYLPPYRAANRLALAALLDIPVALVNTRASTRLVKAIIKQRAIKTPEEIVEITAAVNISNQMHLVAMQHTVAGVTEKEVAAKVRAVALSAGNDIAYPIIYTVNGQTLHNHPTNTVLQSGSLVLCDCGAANSRHYAGDLTRTYPVNATFTTQQNDIYQIVLGAAQAAVKALQPGRHFLEIHLLACEYLFDRLKQLGLVRGNTKEAVEQGAHALFFPCGLGHMLGLDVHDMEDLGEQYVGYTDTLQKSEQFGLKSLRLARPLEPGFVLTVEPGIYFIPELIDRWAAEKKFTQYINYAQLAGFRNFGGARVEENYNITTTGANLLGDPLAKETRELEQLVGWIKG